MGSEEEVDRLREDLRILFKWSEDWQMAFNVDKCSVIHFGFNNNGFDLTLGGRLLEVHESEKDLGVMVQCNLKVDKQCCKAANDANRKLGMIKRQWRSEGGQGDICPRAQGYRGAHFWVRTSDVTLNFGPHRISKMGPQFL